METAEKLIDLATGNNDTYRQLRFDVFEPLREIIFGGTEVAVGALRRLVGSRPF